MTKDSEGLLAVLHMYQVVVRTLITSGLSRRQRLSSEATLREQELIESQMV